MPEKRPRLTREAARRIAVRAQMLDADRSIDILAVVERLTFLQLDPTAVVAPSADLVAWSRLSNAFQPSQLQQATENDRTLFEHRAQDSEFEPAIVMLRPMANLGLYLAEMAAWPFGSRKHLDWLGANDVFLRNLLDLLRSSGPLLSRDIPDTSTVPWASSGWTNDRNVTQMLEFLATRGEVAVSKREGRQRLWDLAERIYPPDTRVIPRDEARKIRNENRLRSLGIAREKIVGDAGLAVEVDDTNGLWRIDPQASAEGFAGRTALLSPFDRLIHNRPRAMEFFDFDYILEMYKPREKRRWGFFALPILYHDKMVGKVDTSADRNASRLVVHALHEDVPFTAIMKSSVEAELETLALWLKLDGVRHG